MNACSARNGGPWTPLSQPERDRRFPLAHHQCGWPRRRTVAKHPGGAGRSRHDGSGTFASPSKVHGAPSTTISSEVASTCNSPNDWFLRSSFVVELQPGLHRCHDPATDPPPQTLPPGLYPIIEPKITTYGIVQPIARRFDARRLA